MTRSRSIAPRRVSPILQALLMITVFLLSGAAFLLLVRIAGHIS